MRELRIFPAVVGGVVGEWYFASCELDSPPEWLKRNGAVSWSYKSLQEQDVNGSTRLLRGLITEVSLLSPSVKPAEPTARVAWIGSPAAGPDGEVIGGQRIVRHGCGELLGVR